MTETLFLRLSKEGVAAWAVFDTTGRLASPVGSGSLEAARTAVEGRRVAVLVPGIDVIAAEVDLPSAGQARLRQIVPFSLEDSFADDVEELSFAIGARLPSGAMSVSVVAKHQIDMWLASLRGAGIAAHAIYSEADGVPDIPATLVLLIQGGRVYGRRPEHAPFVLDGMTLRQVLDLVRGQESEAADLGHLLVYVDEAGHEQFRQELGVIREEFASVEIKVATDGLFGRLAATLAQRGGTNLLQGGYAPSSNWRALVRPWRVAASLLVASGALGLLLQGAQLWQLWRTDRALGELVAASCQRTVGDARTSACQREVQQRLGANATSASSEDFLSTLTAIAATRAPEMRIDALSYRNRVMDLQLVATSVPALDEFARGLEQTRRFDTEIEAANQTDAGTEGRVRIVGVSQ